jgi:hypothetical protein
LIGRAQGIFIKGVAIQILGHLVVSAKGQAGNHLLFRPSPEH